MPLIWMKDEDGKWIRVSSKADADLEETREAVHKIFEDAYDRVENDTTKWGLPNRFREMEESLNKRFHDYKPHFTETVYDESELAEYNTYSAQAGGGFADAKTVTSVRRVVKTHPIPQKASAINANTSAGEGGKTDLGFVTCFLLAIVIGLVVLAVLSMIGVLPK